MGIDACTVTVYRLEMVSFSSIIDKWPSAEQFGRDLGLKTYAHGRLMKRRNSIPPIYWPKLLKAAEARNIKLTEKHLLAAQKARAEA